MVTWLHTRVSRSQADLGPSGSNLHVTLERPAHPGAVIIIAHSGSDHGARPRNRRVAEHLQAAGLVTACIDLPEQPAGSISATGMRASTVTLIGAARWVAGHADLAALPIGILVADGEAMDALEAAAVAPELISAVVVRGGRLEPRAPYLPDVVAPTLLIVGGRGASLAGSHRETLARLGGPRHLVVVPGAGPAFEEAGALEEAAEWTAEWFVRHLVWEHAGTVTST